jgi:hypothetical protein
MIKGIEGNEKGEKGSGYANSWVISKETCTAASLPAQDLLLPHAEKAVKFPGSSVAASASGRIRSSCPHFTIMEPGREMSSSYSDTLCSIVSCLMRGVKSRNSLCRQFAILTDHVHTVSQWYIIRLYLLKNGKPLCWKLAILSQGTQKWPKEGFWHWISAARSRVLSC